MCRCIIKFIHILFARYCLLRVCVCMYVCVFVCVPVSASRTIFPLIPCLLCSLKSNTSVPFHLLLPPAATVVLATINKRHLIKVQAQEGGLIARYPIENMIYHRHWRQK